MRAFLSLAEDRMDSCKQSHSLGAHGILPDTDDTDFCPRMCTCVHRVRLKILYVRSITRSMPYLIK